MILKTDWSILKWTLYKIVGIEEKINPKKLTQDAVDILNEANELMKNNLNRNENKIWLVYWKVQSWKTNAMIASTALAFDNWYKIAIILTSNNTELVTQTRDRFSDKVFWVEYFIETLVYQEVKNSTSSHIALKDDDSRLILIVPKGAPALETIIHFLSTLEWSWYKTIIFDDEWDNYSLDNNRSERDEEEDLPPTRINELIFARLRNKVNHILVSVTWTPQWVLLEWTNQSLWFKYLLEPGDTYVWWETFFKEEDIYDNPYMNCIDPDEVIEIYEKAVIAPWLKDALLTFYTVATLFNFEHSDKFADFLCHPNLKVDYHKSFKMAIYVFHHEIMSWILNEDTWIINTFRWYFDKLKLKEWHLYFDQFLKLLKQTILKTKIIQLNAQQKDSKLSWRHHIMIWWNILWRWVTIENMLVMYYWRNAKTTNMDTLYQHARMFWYRKNLLKYMKIYMPEDVYEKFHFTYETDEWLRDMVRVNPKNDFPIKFFNKNWSLRFTRPQIESKSFLSNIFIPRRQFYPNFISEENHIQNAKYYLEIENTLKSVSPIEDFENWVLVNNEVINNILRKITSSSTNQWKGEQPIDILLWLLADETDKNICVYINKAETRTWKQWAIWTGTLDWSKVDLIRKEWHIGLCFSSFAYKDNQELWKLWYPTIVFPERYDTLWKVYIVK
ncbi:MAG: hypothetical protein ACD_3C00192G0010 [uncultured bacterium (gcode 4)]|uniref:Putative endonuclease Z1 domain-containing protein n=1 Tax=uncultured bacterium (gcode 4) TaxID=1234023 RepID=K2GW49_9BACT|nr:MAG: hypothetical protein ACD_3C00192G0010 [uncultured bacterium (gcode 4)]